MYDQWILLTLKGLRKNLIGPFNRLKKITYEEETPFNFTFSSVLSSILEFFSLHGQNSFYFKYISDGIHLLFRLIPTYLASCRNCLQGYVQSSNTGNDTFIDCNLNSSASFLIGSGVSLTDWAIKLSHYSLCHNLHMESIAITRHSMDRADQW